MSQLIPEHIQVDFANGWGDRSIDAAVDAIKIAHLVGVEIDTNGQSFAPAADHRIDVPVVAPGTTVLRKDRDEAHLGESYGSGRIKKAVPGKDGFEWGW